MVLGASLVSAIGAGLAGACKGMGAWRCIAVAGAS
jgi:hypothetical protein